jgi:hypothetical protein
MMPIRGERTHDSNAAVGLQRNATGIESANTTTGVVDWIMPKRYVLSDIGLARSPPR